MKIFTYGTLQSGGNNNYIMLKASGTFISKCKTKDKYFKDCIKDGYGNNMYPYILKTVPHGPVYAKIYIKGELWNVPDENVQIIDKFEDGYIRKCLTLQDNTTTWAYFITQELYQKTQRKIKF